MKPSLLREITLYRYRYLIGYGVFLIFLGVLLSIDLSRIPYGISDAEMASSVASNSLNPLSPRASDVINLPYHVLQKASIGLWGLSTLTIKLPSLVLAFIAAILLALTLNQWFRKGTAMLALLLATASVPFMSMARSGTGEVLYMLLLVLILLAAVRLSSRAKGTFFWKLMAALAGLLLIYMPLGIYAVAALLVAGIFHPHVRYQIKRTAWWQLAVLFFMAGVITAPLIIAVVNDPATIETLLGIDALRAKLSISSIGTAASSLLLALFGFTKPQTGAVITPFLSLTFMFFVAFGLVRTIIDRHAARSYLLHIWLLVSVPLLILNPSQFALLFVPAVMLMAIGLESFMREWYKLFPRNPYARIAALVPLTLIIVGLVTIESSRYFYGYAYTRTEAHHPELRAIRDVIRPQVPTRLVVPDSQLAFYDILRSNYPLLTVSTQPSKPDTATTHIVLAASKVGITRAPVHIVTSHYATDAVLLRVYAPAD